MTEIARRRRHGIDNKTALPGVQIQTHRQHRAYSFHWCHRARKEAAQPAPPTPQTNDAPPMTDSPSHPPEPPTPTATSQAHLPHTFDVAAALLVAPVVAALDSHDACVMMMTGDWWKMRKRMGEKGARRGWEEPAQCIGVGSDQAHLWKWLWVALDEGRPHTQGTEEGAGKGTAGGGKSGWCRPRLPTTHSSLDSRLLFERHATLFLYCPRNQGQDKAMHTVNKEGEEGFFGQRRALRSRSPKAGNMRMSE